MEQQNMNMGGMTPNGTKSTGIIISIVIIVLVLALGVFYFSKQTSVSPAVGTTQTLTPSEVAADQTISKLSTQGTSIEIVDIQKDLITTDFSNLDAGLSDIDL